MTDVSDPLLEGLEQATAWLRGEPVDGLRVHRVVRPDPKAVRESLQMTQEAFAAAFGIPVATLRGWEMGRRRPDATAAAYLDVIARAPDQVRAARSAASFDDRAA